MKNAHFLTLIIAMLVTSSLSNSQATNPITLNKPELKAIYDVPAEAWDNNPPDGMPDAERTNFRINRALPIPIGNGYMGAMIYGGVNVDVIQLNEHTLWSGGPGANANYDGGHKGTAANIRQNLQNLRQGLQDKMTVFSETNAAYLDASGKVIASDYSTENAQMKSQINVLMGQKDNFGSYQAICNLNISNALITTPLVVNIQSDCDNPGAGEKVVSLFDGNLETKWYADQGFKQVPCYIKWEYDIPFTTGSYSLVSGNDVPGRDPKAWELWGANENEDSKFVKLDVQTGITFDSRRQTKTFTLPATVTCKYFKLILKEISASGNPPQLSEIILNNENASLLTPYTNYSRILDIDNALASVTYQEDNIAYAREYFMNYPDNVMVIKLSADQNGKLSKTFWITTLQSKATITAENDMITLTGYPSDHNPSVRKGLKFAQQFKIIPTGGNMTASNGKITVNNADEILVIMSAATNYVQCMDNSFNYFSNEDPLNIVNQRIITASKKGFTQLLSEHQQDYKELYNRMELSLNNIVVPPVKTTNSLIFGYGKTNTPEENLYLETLYYQYGRYLLIASSRENTLPANLQGVWADGLTPPWDADYHTNINLQMNYWLAEQTNLSSCHLPLVEYINSLVPRGKLTAQQYYCKQDGRLVRGWVDHHENNIWGNTAPGNWYEGFYFPAAAAWLCQDIWEYFRFNEDKQFLEKNYNTMLEAALFWVDNLWRDSRDGSLVANPSYSPEHGAYSLGASCDQAIIWELFDMVIKSSEILGKNTPETEEIKIAKSKLAGPQIGLSGQFMEWKDEIKRDITGDGGHRHANHLFWLHPGTQIIAGRSGEEDRYVEAMKQTLNTRGDGGTGWSKAWKINFWARLRDGNRSHKLVEEILKESTMYNLFDTHPPFQIDGNFGSTAGMTEMLVQSQGDCIEILPALPDAWPVGIFKGIKARGNFEINCQWDNKVLETMEIISHSGNDCIIKYNGIQHFNISQQGGNQITPTIISGDKISFPTTKGATYIISNL